MGSGRKFDARADALASSLVVLSEGSPPVLPECVRGVQSLLGADIAVACEFVTTDRGWRAERLPTGSASGDRLRCALGALCSPGEGGAAPAGACPLATAPGNPVATLDEVKRALPRETAEDVRRSLADSGLGRHDVLRVLVADERRPLTCIAAIRGYRFDDAERRGVERVARALRHRISLERRLRDAPIADAGLAAAMNAIRAPAFLVRSGEDVVHANALGRARLEAHRDATRRAIAAAWAGRPPQGVEVTTVRSPGAPHHALVVLRPTSCDVEGRAAELGARWALTPRQREVLAWVARGASNKGIGERLGCAESTVELHVTALLRRSGCECRAQLVAEFWTSA